MNNFGLYLIITCPLLPYSIIAETCAEEKVAFLQFREKELTDREIVYHTRLIKDVLKNSVTKLVINDRPDIAKIVEADVLHLGQEDLPVDEARKIVGDMPIGLSTHNLQQLEDALNYHPLYVGFGPVYATTTKKRPDPVVGTELLKKALQISNVPVVAIGGIFPQNIDEVLAVGARNIAMVRYFMESKTKYELREKIQLIKQKIKDYDTITTSH